MVWLAIIGAAGLGTVFGLMATPRTWKTFFKTFMETTVISAVVLTILISIISR